MGAVWIPRMPECSDSQLTWTAGMRQLDVYGSDRWRGGRRPSAQPNPGRLTRMIATSRSAQEVGFVVVFNCVGVTT